MCLWCAVEERVYRSYQDQERKALEAILKIRQDCPDEAERDECSDRPRCIWERKMDYVVARVKRERLAAELAESEVCPPSGSGRNGRIVAKVPPPSVPAHLLLAFERTIETLFDRLTSHRRPASERGKRSRKILRFEAPPDPAR